MNTITLMINPCNYTILAPANNITDTNDNTNRQQVLLPNYRNMCGTIINHTYHILEVYHPRGQHCRYNTESRCMGHRPVTRGRLLSQPYTFNWLKRFRWNQSCILDISYILYSNSKYKSNKTRADTHLHALYYLLSVHLCTHNTHRGCQFWTLIIINCQQLRHYERQTIVESSTKIYPLMVCSLSWI